MNARLRALARNPHALPLALLTLAVLLLFAPTFHLYFWYGHERYHPVVRVREVCRLWAAQGPFQTPWFPETCFGQGWPFFTFYAPLSYWIAAAFHFLFGLSYGAATKASFMAAVWASGGVMYALVWTMLKNCGSRIADCGLEDTPKNPHSAFRNPHLNWWAFASSTVYIFAPYHITEVFTRGSLAEAWAWAAIPGLILALERARGAFEGQGARDKGQEDQIPCPMPRAPFTPPAPGHWPLFWIALAGAALIITHTLFAMYGALIVGLWVVLTARSWRWFATAAAGGVLAAVLTAFFWLPVAVLKKYVPVGDVEVMNGIPRLLHGHAVHWQQFFIERIGMGESLPGWREWFGINLGACVGIGLLLGLAALFRPGLARFERRRLAVMLALAAAAMFVMSTAMPWDRAPNFLRYMQFPWRMLLLTSMFGSMALGCSAPAARRWLNPLWLAGLAAALGLMGAWLNCFNEPPPPMSDAKLTEFMNEEERAYVFAGCQQAEYRPLSVLSRFLNYKLHEDFPPRRDRILDASAPFNLVDFLHRGTAYYYTYTAASEVKVVIQVFYFPGWVVRVDGERAQERLGLDKTGYVTLRLPPGSHVAELKYELSPPGRQGRWISAAGWAVLLGCAAWMRRRNPPRSAA